MIPGTSIIALKEWAVTVAALERGKQILLLRKGGIREDGKHFKVEHDGFFLYPTYDHQTLELLKPEFHPLYGETLDDEDPNLVHLSSYAEVVEVFEISDEAAAKALEEFHIWSPEYAEKRVHWKPLHPLKVIALRVHLLEQPQALPVMPEYDGCKSWVRLVEEYPVGVATPVLNDRRFDRRLDEIRAVLGEPVAS
ncbi:MAG: DUF1802 family protein [Acidobacteria bacterium]|nr:DUF1802 family protein [Acidobacteriota bacterium]